MGSKKFVFKTLWPAGLLQGHQDEVGYPTTHKVAVSGHVHTHANIIVSVHDFSPTENLLS